MSSITEQLKVTRLADSISQSDLGAKLGLPQSHISKIEQGATDPRLSTVLDMARVLDHDLVLIPRQMIQAVQALLRGEGNEKRRFMPDENETDEKGKA